MSVIGIKNIQSLQNIRQFSLQRFNVERLRQVAQHPNLTDGEKLFWLMIAQHPGSYHQSIFQISDNKIATLIGEKITNVPKIIKKMENLGFIEINNHDFFQPRYKLSLPDNCLHSIVDTHYLWAKPSFTTKSRRKTPKMYIFKLNIFKQKILKRNANKSYENSYLGNCNILASKYKSQLGIR